MTPFTTVEGWPPGSGRYCSRVTFTIVRHAHAGKRGAWVGDDRDRPLSAEGRFEAGLIAERLLPQRPNRLVSSPALRCQESLGPLADALDTDVEVDKRLFEGPREPWLSDLIVEAADDDWVVCTHGDVIPVLLHLLIDDGLDAPRSPKWHKGSAWTIERRHGAWTSASYWRPRS